MPVDSSIYFQQQPIDFLGNIQKGMQMGQQLQDRKYADIQRQQQAQLAEAQKSAIVQNPDGTFSFDQNKYGNALGILAGQGNRAAAQEAQTLGQTMYSQKLAQTKYADDQKQQEIDNDLRRQALASSAADRKEARDERRFQAGVQRDEKIQGLQTPFGLANTTDDAKQLKEAYESKRNFDNKIDQMIALREKHGGGAIMNREDVSRGKQLSKDLLLEYKNMAKLGVLSQSDEDIINAIIPEDPLQYNSPMASLQGQDPTLARLKSFKGDSDKDFQTRINIRTRSGINGLRNGSELNSSPGMKMQDSQAVQWAKKNPNDPRAKQIFQLNGIGG